MPHLMQGFGSFEDLDVCTYKTNFKCLPSLGLSTHWSFICHFNFWCPQNNPTAVCALFSCTIL